MAFDLYQTVTDQITAMLEKGVAPWRSPILGRTSAGHPKNLESTKPYRGLNVFLLAFTAWSKGYPCGSGAIQIPQAKDRSH
jgi:antirestriction protein ArdC